MTFDIYAKTAGSRERNSFKMMWKAFMEELLRELDSLRKELLKQQKKKNKLKYKNIVEPFWILRRKKVGGSKQKCGPKSRCVGGKFKAKQKNCNFESGRKNTYVEICKIYLKLDFNWKRIIKIGNIIANWMPSEVVKLKVMCLLD